MMKEVGLHEGNQKDRGKSIETQLVLLVWRDNKKMEGERETREGYMRSVTHEEIKPSAEQMKTD